MRFVIVGAGRVGLRTARVLAESDHEVVLVERDPATAERAREAGFEVIEGDGGLEKTLDGADLASADALGGLTGDLNDNFVACMIAKEHGCRTVMRIDEDYREEIYREYAQDVDEVIYPERLGAMAAKNALVGGNVRAVADVAPHLQLVEFTIEADAPLRGYSLEELQFPANAELLAFGKAGEALRLPDADDTMEPGDCLVVLSDFDVLGDVRQLVTGANHTQPATGGA